MRVPLVLSVVVTCGALGFLFYRYGWQNSSNYTKSSKRSRRRDFLRLKRCRRRNERLKAKKLEESQIWALKQATLTSEEKHEKRERICMQRVEQYQKLEEGQSSSVRVVVDLAFAPYETVRERHSLFKQLGGVYGYLKTCPLDRLISLTLVSCTQDIADISAQHGVPNCIADNLVWKLQIKQQEKSIEQLYNTHEVVYLSPDSDYVLEKLDLACIYVVGGIVDRSVRKSETISKATACGFRTARLPLQEHLEFVRTHILNIDSVLIALNEFANHGNWERAFMRAIPQRITCKKRRQSMHAMKREPL
ncbi:uncharacterized protein CCR75_002143 [Bremia lactucae]|uniref:tRNA (guanine(9)-N(1))-methyltransferase n=1 Tax=Bremia lactucae TaxID=4779 RepID=A0A976IAH9_BRELC|nr:hypothetical protein CCR75_002143 [Bremia lactucae]